MASIGQICSGFLDLLLPRMCAGCGRHLALTETHVCPHCVMLLDRVTDWDWRNNRRALLWREHRALWHVGAFAFFRRGGIVANMVHTLKYHGQHHLGVWMGRLAATELRQSGLFDEVELLIPVPLTRRRRMHRGFNQAERIAAGMSEVLGIPVDEHVLRRRLERTSQTHFTLKQRMSNVQNAFVLRPEAAQRLAGHHVMVVDDVMTTGATLLSTLQALEGVPGVKVSVFAWAWVHLPEHLDLELEAGTET